MGDERGSCPLSFQGFNISLIGVVSNKIFVFSSILSFKVMSVETGI
jgi:hypothetical protein